MDLDTVAYRFDSPAGHFCIKCRLSGRWRVKHEAMPWGDSFPSAQAAAQALAAAFPVPAQLALWQEQVGACGCTAWPTTRV